MTGCSFTAGETVTQQQINADEIDEEMLFKRCDRPPTCDCSCYLPHHKKWQTC
jgi:hypothetical protein